MSGKKFRTVTPAGGVALVAATVKTVHQIVAAANNPETIDFIDISFDGNVSTDTPVEVLVERQTSAPGTPGTAPSVSEVPNGDPGTLQATAVTGGGTEPTGSDDQGRWFLHPQGRHVLAGPFPIVGGDRLGIVCTAPEAQNVHVTCRGEE